MDLEDLSTETVRYRRFTNVQILPTLALLVAVTNLLTVTGQHWFSVSSHRLLQQHCDTR
jgi:hypothetical protein